MLDINQYSDSQKKKLQSSYEKHFKVFLLHTLYIEAPKTSMEQTRNNAVRAMVAQLNGGLFEEQLLDNLGTTVAYQKYSEILEQADIKSWITEICNTLGLSVCSADETNKYLPENRFVLAQITPQHLDSYYMSVFEKALDQSKYGLILLNNPESFPWNAKKVALLKDLLLNSAHTHHSGSWPMVGIMNKADPNLQFNSDFGVSIINEEEWASQISDKVVKKANTNTGGGISGFFKNIFGSSSKTKDVIVSAGTPELEAQNLFDVMEKLERYMKNKRNVIDKEFNDKISELLSSLMTINQSLGNKDVQRENPEFFYSTRTLVGQDLPKILDDYIRSHPTFRQTVDETTGKTYKDLALQNVSNIVEYVGSLKTSLSQQNLLAQKTYEVYLKEKLSKVRQLTPQDNLTSALSQRARDMADEKEDLMIDLTLPSASLPKNKM